MWTRERLRARDAKASRMRAWFGVLLAAAVSILGGLAFGWPGVAAGVALALVHALLARLAAAAPRAALVLWHLVALPATVGTLLAATPFDNWFLVAPVLLALWLSVRTPDRLLLRQNPLPARAAGLVVLALTLFVCDRLPVKPLDRNVGPAQYHGLTLTKLSERLYADHGVYFSIYEDDPAARAVVDFEIPRPMSERAVLEKLARETGLVLQIGFCGTGESLLWGKAPMGVNLRSPRGPG